MADGIRTRDIQIHNLDAESSKGVDNKGLRIATPPVSHHLPTDTCKTDPALTAVVAVWPKLPEAIRAGILAMVRAASGRD